MVLPSPHQLEALQHLLTNNVLVCRFNNSYYPGQIILHSTDVAVETGGTQKQASHIDHEILNIDD